MFIIDAHEDIAYNTICHGRDYRLSAIRKRQLGLGNATLGLPEAIAGRVAVVFGTIFVEPYSKKPLCCDGVLYQNAQEAYTAGMKQLDVYKRLEDDDKRIRLIHTRKDLDAVLATWADDQPVTERVQGILLLMENADPIVEPEQFEEWYEHGVRAVGPAWQASRYCGGTGMPGPLTSKGYELLEIMAGFNALLDLSHMAEQSFLQAVDTYEGVMIASHSNPRHFSDTDRHLSDTMIRRLAERDGVIGTVMYNRFLNGQWTPTDGKQAVTNDTILDVIDYVCQVTGSARHVGIGTDFDGGFGAEAVPKEIDTIADLWWLQYGLEERGFSADDIALILHGNMLRQLHATLPEG